MQRANIRYPLVMLIAVMAMLLAPSAEAFTGTEPAANVASTFLWLAVILLAARISSLIERIGQPPVLGELMVGVILGNLNLLGIAWFEPLRSDVNIRFLAQLGVVILLFQVGLESNLHQMRQVGVRAFLVACVGVAAPFLLGTYLVGPRMLPGLSANEYIFLGATLTATSVGITARVFRDLGKLQTREAQIVLGAAVIDDVLGLLILAVVSALATIGTVSLAVVGLITLKALIFLVGAIGLGRLLAPRLSALFSVIHTGLAMKFTLAISFGLTMAYLADQIGLAPIVGAFAAGLVLDPVHFRSFQESTLIADLRPGIADAELHTRERLLPVIEHHADRHIEELIEPLGHFLVPIFFMMTGMDVKLATFFNGPLLFVALVITIVAFAGKIISGLVAGKVRKLIVGWGMIPRGEVGLIFAATGRSMHIVSDELFSVIVIVIILSTLLTPPILAWLLRTPQPAAVSLVPSD